MYMPGVLGLGIKAENETQGLWERPFPRKTQTKAKGLQQRLCWALGFYSEQCSFHGHGQGTM